MEANDIANGTFENTIPVPPRVHNSCVPTALQDVLMGFAVSHLPWNQQYKDEDKLTIGVLGRVS